VLSLLINLTLLVPCLLGVFWGGPLVAREVETGTTQFTWMQSVSRRRWVAVKVGWALLAAAAWGGAVSALVTWWSSPLNALQHQNFQPGQFDVQGVVPVGYALFAVALGIAAGAVLRRTLPALATTVGVFAALRVVIAIYARPHYMAAITKTYTLAFTHPILSLPGSYWQLSQGVLVPAGQSASSAAHGAVGVSLNGTVVSLPSACRPLLGQGPQKVFSCLADHGYRAFISYQPASRYWPFQGIETGIFAVLAAALIAVAVIAVTRRDV
jgi:hypothetical protein